MVKEALQREMDGFAEQIRSLISEKVRSSNRKDWIHRMETLLGEARICKNTPSTFVASRQNLSRAVQEGETRLHAVRNDKSGNFIQGAFDVAKTEAEDYDKDLKALLEKMRHGRDRATIHREIDQLLLETENLAPLTRACNRLNETIQVVRAALEKDKAPTA